VSKLAFRGGLFKNRTVLKPMSGNGRASSAASVDGAAAEAYVCERASAPSEWRAKRHGHQWRKHRFHHPHRCGTRRLNDDLAGIARIGTFCSIRAFEAGIPGDVQ
jgi:hypothetical protein